MARKDWLFWLEAIKTEVKGLFEMGTFVKVDALLEGDTLSRCYGYTHSSMMSWTLSSCTRRGCQACIQEQSGAFCAIAALGDYNPTQGGHFVL